MRGLAPVACALDGAEAITVIREHVPDLTLVDLDMPLADGVEAISQISKTSPQVTVLAVTGSAEQCAAEALAACARACVSRRDLQASLERLIRRSP